MTDPLPRAAAQPQRTLDMKGDRKVLLQPPPLRYQLQPWHRTFPERWKLHDAVCLIDASRLRTETLPTVATIAMDS